MEEGPFWVCAFAIYQNNDPSKGVMIGEQLGSNPEYGPFATVLKVVNLMLSVMTNVCDIYTHLCLVMSTNQQLSVDNQSQDNKLMLLTIYLIRYCFTNYHLT